MRIDVLDDAEEDLANGYVFYELQRSGLGRRFFRSLWSEIDSLRKTAGIHPIRYGGYHRLLARRFPFAVFYRVVGQVVRIHAVID